MEAYRQEPEAAAGVQDDPQARELLKRAFEKTARWQPDFRGFTADVTVNIDGRESRGSVTVQSPETVQVNLADPAVQKWVNDQLQMIAVHRSPRAFAESDGKYRLALGPEEEDRHHPFGPRVFLQGDRMQSFYRVAGDRITQINRKMEHTAFTINVEESSTTQDGNFLTTRYTVYYYSPQDGRLTNVESFSDTHTRVASSDLPATRRIISYESGTVTVKLLTFQHHKML